MKLIHIRIKFVEKSGMKLIDKIRIVDPWSENCKEEDCLACKSSNKITNCRKSNVGYRIKCKKCDSEGKKFTYEGETARNMYQRSKEHVKLVEKKSENSPLFKHMKAVHDEEKCEFQMTMAGCFKSPLTRITHEGVRIKNMNENQLMNSQEGIFWP